VFTASSGRGWLRTGLLAGSAAAAALAPVSLANATSASPTVLPGYAISLFASAPSGASSPDDICRLGDEVFVGYQNGVGPNGEPNASGGTASTIVEYNRDGSVVNQWSVTGKVDGLGSDPGSHRVIATVNEDSNSSLVTITPSAPPADQLVHYRYSPSPSPASGSGPVLTGGGTDAVTVMPDGTVLIAASNPQTLGANPQTIVGGAVTATFHAVLTPPAAGATTGVAALSATFLDDSQASVAPTASPSVALALSDPDSNAAVPDSSLLYARQFLQVSQGDHQLIFARDIGSSAAPYNASDLTVLNLQEQTGATTTSAGVDDVRWVDGHGGTFYVVDDSGGPGGNGAIYAITGAFLPGEVLAAVSETGAPNSSAVLADGHTVDTLNLATGILTPFATGFAKASGEVWVPRERLEHHRRHDGRAD
jgi:hypothetical protein